MCRGCEEESRSFFCGACWEKIAPLSPFGRCEQCFAEIEGEETRCGECSFRCQAPFRHGYVFESHPLVSLLLRKKKECPEPFAGWLLAQWSRLDWPLPDCVIPFPGMEEIAQIFALDLQTDFVDCLRKGRMGWRLLERGLPDSAVLLLLDEGIGKREKRKASAQLLEAMPRQMFILSLCKRQG